MYTNKMQFDDLANGLDGFEIHNKLYSQLVTEEMTSMLKRLYSSLLNECRQSKDKHFNDVKTLSFWDRVGESCYMYVNHDLRKDLGICNSLSTKVYIAKVAVRLIIKEETE